MELVVKYIENDKNTSNVIGIYCTAGHHRSVAIIEILKKYIYVDAVVKHLHINR